MPTPRRTGKFPTKAAAGPSSSPVVVNARTRRAPASKEDDEDSDPMALSASPKKRKAMHDSPEVARGSPRLRARGNSINYAELNNGKGREGSVKGEEEEDNVELNKRSSRRTSAVASTSSPAKRSAAISTTPAKTSTSKPTPTSSRPRRISRSSPFKPDVAPSSSTSSRPAAAGRRPQRSPSPSATTSSPRKPAGWIGWEVATEPLEEHPQKGFLSGLEILKKQGLLDPEGERRLRNGRTVAKPVGKKDRRGGEARWGEEDEEEEEGEEENEEEEGAKDGVMDWEEEIVVGAAPRADEVVLQPQPQFEPQQQRQDVFSPDLPAHLAKTKARVLAHLTGRLPPRPTPQPAVDVKGKGKARDASPIKETERTEDVNAESVKTLVELLKGTVERGEGNSCLIQGVKGGGKTTVLNQALDTLIASTSEPGSDVPPPIVIRLSALVQTDDRAAIREIGRQVGVKGVDGEDAVGADAEGEGGDEAKEVLQITTLPAHLLSILTAPSKKAIVIVLDEFDLFAGFGRGGRQMLLYCLLDVVQSIRPCLASGVLSSRGVAVIGLTSRIDTLHLLEKRVKSRFSHRIIRVSSVLHGDQSKNVVALRPEDAVPLEEEKVEEKPKWVGVVRGALLTGEEEGEWEEKWRKGVERVIGDEGVKRGMERLGWMTGDIRAALRVFIRPVLDLTPSQPMLTTERIQRSLTEQAEGAGFGLHLHKLAGLSPPELAVLASVKDLGERGITEFNFEHVFFTYGEFAKAKLVGSGKPRFSRGSMREAFTTLTLTSLIFPTSSSSSAASTSSGMGIRAADFAKHRCALPAFDLVEFFRSDAGKRGVMTQLSAWGRKWDV